MKLDHLEKRILRELQSDGRMTNAELARRVGISESPCLRRRQALEQAGVITTYKAVVDQKKMGYNITAYVSVNSDQRTETDARTFVEAVSAEPRIIECHAVSGDSDFLLKVIARDVDDLADLTMRRVLRLPTIKNIVSHIVFATIKGEQPIPVWP